MSLPEPVRDTLMNVGQVAAEVACPIEGYRDFVSVYAAPRDKVSNVSGRFPYFEDAAVIYRCIRFRVMSELIDEDADVGPHDLAGLQEIFLPSQESVEFVLGVWRVPASSLLPPREVEIPV